MIAASRRWANVRRGFFHCGREALVREPVP